MGLIIPKGPSWKYYESNISGTPGTVSPGTAVAAGTDDADGSVVTLIAELDRDVEYIRLSISDFILFGGIDCSTLLDILYDPAGGTSWQSLIDDLIAGALAYNASSVILPTRSYDFPIWIPAGSSIGARARCAHTATVTGRVVIQVFGGNESPASWWCGQSVTAVGVDPDDSGGTAHTAGNSGSFSDWADLGTAIARDVGALQYAVGNEGDTSATAASYRFEFGVSSVRIGPEIMAFMNSTADSVCQWGQGVTFVSLPAGTQLQVRGTSSTTAVPVDVAAYAVH
jgi:hypothetical protein